ncbi:MAG: Rpn family recombination-promoting nuclease/putative transposase [Alphaproteobacteria bacterium]
MSNKNPEPTINQTDKPFKLLDPKSDIVFKKIFGQHPELIKSFLNSILPLAKGRIIESIDYLPHEQAPRIPSMKNTIVDVKCTDQDGHIFIVEMQMTWSTSFLKRFLFGTSKAYVQQLDRGNTYDTLCPVYGLAIVNETFDKTTKDWFHHYRLTNVQDLDKSLEGLELVFLELPKFTPQTFIDRKMGALWLRFLKEIDGPLLSIPQEFQDNPDIAKAVELTQESSYTKAELEAYDYYLDAVRVEQTIRVDSKRSGLEEGEQIGIAKGKAEGREEGEQIGIRKTALNMLRGGMSIDSVSSFTGLSVDELENLLKSGL